MEKLSKLYFTMIYINYSGKVQSCLRFVNRRNDNENNIQEIHFYLELIIRRDRGIQAQS